MRRRLLYAVSQAPAYTRALVKISGEGRGREDAAEMEGERP